MDRGGGDAATYYDSPERSSEEQLRALAARLASDPVIKQLLDGFPEMAAILDSHRQIVACNDKMLEVCASLGGSDAPLGRRVGEALNCVRSDEMLAGCGTSIFCRECGAAHAIRKTIETARINEQECRISRRGADGYERAFEFRVETSPLRVGDLTLTIFSLRDIADEKRRRALERVFFHDVLNTAGAIQAAADLMMGEADEETRRDVHELLTDSVKQLIEEIRAQCDLVKAENGELPVRPEETTANALLVSTFRAYATQPLADAHVFTCTPLAVDATIETDIVLMGRALGNLVKNALEATPSGGAVSLEAEDAEDVVRFHVRNPGAMTEPTHHQIFQRSFTTKGPGRGVGTHSAKLLVERYLHGSIGFVSDAAHGTTFTITLPKLFQSPASH